MLDVGRIERVRLSRRPFMHRFLGGIIHANYRLMGVRTIFEGWERVPPPPVIFAMNHTDRFNPMPFQVRLMLEHRRFCVNWVKGKYYENALLGFLMEKTNNVPAVSRGYLITRDFIAAMGRAPGDDEYTALRAAVDADAVGEAFDGDTLPRAVREIPRDVMGRPYDPDRETYPHYINALFQQMMARFVGLNRQAIERAIDLVIFPEGTRTVRLKGGHIGLAQVALHLGATVVPVGCNGSDLIYPGNSPIAKRGEVRYRFGDPIGEADRSEFAPNQPYAPFSPEAEREHRERFEGFTALIMMRIEELLDDRHRPGTADETEAKSARFV